MVGSNFLNESGDTYETQKLIEHASYVARTITNDIALIRLKEGIKYGDKIQPVKLPAEDTGCNKELILSGWGTTSVNIMTK